MEYSETLERLDECRKGIADLRMEMRALQKSVEPQKVDDYVFTTNDGSVRLSELFGDKDDLFVIHNMGKSCTYCTLWADGFNGMLAHLQDRAGFVVTSPDSPAVQRDFATGRGWRFKMLSLEGTDFAKDMGYASDKGYLPGVSVFHRAEGKISRVSDTMFGPGDDFNALWHLFDLMPEGSNGWQVKYDY